MSHAYAMVARHLMKISTCFDNGIPYHYTDPVRVNEIKDIVKRCATKLDYGLPTSGTAHLRLNYVVKEGAIKESWSHGGGVLTSEDVDAQVEAICQRVLAANPGKVIKSTQLTCSILNEWERYVVVFDLGIMVGIE